MRKILFILSLSVASATAMANYNSMEFKYTDGTVKTIGTDGLTITFVNSELIVVNSQGESIAVPASSLVSMQFTEDDEAGVASINLNNNGFEVYNLEGVNYGKFNSLQEARASLSKGVYLIKNAKGETIKIVLEK